MKTFEQVKKDMEQKSLEELIDSYGTFSYMVGAMTQKNDPKFYERLDRDRDVRDYVRFLISEKLKEVK